MLLVFLSLHWWKAYRCYGVHCVVRLPLKANSSKPWHRLIFIVGNCQLWSFIHMGYDFDRAHTIIQSNELYWTPKRSPERSLNARLYLYVSMRTYVVHICFVVKLDMLLEMVRDYWDEWFVRCLIRYLVNPLDLPSGIDMIGCNIGVRLVRGAHAQRWMQLGESVCASLFCISFHCYDFECCEIGRNVGNF